VNSSSMHTTGSVQHTSIAFMKMMEYAATATSTSSQSHVDEEQHTTLPKSVQLR